MLNSIELPMAASLRPRAPLPERRRAEVSTLSLMLRMLDEIDYGLLLVTAQGELCYANRLGAQELASDGPLHSAGGRLAVLTGPELSRLNEALLDAVRGRRTLVTLGLNGHTLEVAVVPIDAVEGAPGHALALLLFNKRNACAALTLAFYARAKKLTATESAVLTQLSQGVKPKQIARVQGVKLSTVRTQIASIRGKTGTASIGALVGQVADLPPFAPVVRAAAFRSDAAVPRPHHAPIAFPPMAAAAC